MALGLWFGRRERSGRSEKIRVPRGIATLAKTPKPAVAVDLISHILEGSVIE